MPLLSRQNRNTEHVVCHIADTLSNRKTGLVRYAHRAISLNVVGLAAVSGYAINANLNFRGVAEVGLLKILRADIKC